eukprot:359022-Chlamydomonas_euryale.AAC.1
MPFIILLPMSSHADGPLRAVFARVIPHSDRASRREKDHERARFFCDARGRIRARNAVGSAALWWGCAGSETSLAYNLSRLGTN